jgi:hypothetical protein
MSERYYLSLLAYQSAFNWPHKSHCFATFIHEAAFHTISWLPASKKVSFFCRKEPGRNLTLEETFAYANSINAKIYHTGTFRIQYELYEKGLAQIERLKNGKVLYQILGNNLEISNCIQAISNVAGKLRTHVKWGIKANHLIINHFKPWIIYRVS